MLLKMRKKKDNYVYSISQLEVVVKNMMLLAQNYLRIQFRNNDMGHVAYTLKGEISVDSDLRDSRKTSFRGVVVSA